MKQFIYIFIFSLFFLSYSCLGTKKVTEKTSDKNQKELSVKTSDSSSKETINQKINDKATVKITESNTGNKDFDEAVNKAVTNILKAINFQKSSGDNSYKLYYDEQLNELRAEIEMGETRNKETLSDNSNLSEKLFQERIEENTKKIIHIIPWWGWLIVVWLLRKHVIGIIAIFIPGIKGVQTVNDLFNPPNKKEYGAN